VSERRSLPRRIAAPSAPKPHRRRFLRGLGGLCLALPFLETLAPKRAHAATPSNRYVFMFGGMSIGSNDEGKIAPATEGPLAGALTRGLAPLGDFGVTDVVSLVSGLSIPVAETPPAAGRPYSFHSTSHQVISTGRRFDTANWGVLPDQTSDWLAAAKLAGDTLQANLVYRAQPAFYRGANPEGGTDGLISARYNGAGQLEPVPPITSPRVAFESLFSGFVPPDPAQADGAKRLLRMRQSVVDLVADDAAALKTRLSASDQLRMQRHFDELRSLETRLDELELPDIAACQMPTHPGEDPPIGNAIDPSSGGDYNENYTNSNGYSDEERRATILTDLIHMAFACDISRVSSLMLTHAQCFMNMYTLLNLPSDLHEISHGSIGGGTMAEMQDALADCAAWHVKHFARLVQKLRDTEDADGSSLLDRTALALAFEGGFGLDPEQDAQGSAHSSENMAVLIGGKAGGLNASGGRHLRATGRHPAEVINTAMQAVGVSTQLGEVSGSFDELMG
jgi:hypothetical protein